MYDFLVDVIAKDSSSLTGKALANGYQIACIPLVPVDFQCISSSVGISGIFPPVHGQPPMTQLTETSAESNCITLDYTANLTGCSSSSNIGKRTLCDTMTTKHCSDNNIRKIARQIDDDCDTSTGDDDEVDM
jgi:hypothetical protein